LLQFDDTGGVFDYDDGGVDDDDDDYNDDDVDDDDDDYDDASQKPRGSMKTSELKHDIYSLQIV